MSRTRSGRAARGRSRGLERATLLGGATLLGLVALAQLDASLFQWHARRTLERELVRLDEPDLVELGRSAAAPWDPEASRPAPGDPLGLLEIPAIDLSVIVIEGTDPTSLRRAVGRIGGTALPGETGNLAIAGHRDGFFRGLRELRSGARIRLRTAGATYEYELVSTEVVRPESIEVLRASGPGRMLTLVTCHPFDYVGSAPDRFVAHAREVAHAD